jgi:hypothetical protein
MRRGGLDKPFFQKKNSTTFRAEANVPQIHRLEKVFAQIVNLLRSANRHPFIWTLLASLAVVTDVSAQNGLGALVAWVPSVSGNVAGYKIYYSTTSGHYTNVITADAFTTSTQLSGLKPGAVYFVAVVTVDSLGHESAKSPEVYFITPSAPVLRTKLWRDQYGNSYLNVFTSDPITRSWELDYTLDFINWYPYDYGYDIEVNVFAPTFFDWLPQMYFRVVMD